MLFEAVSLNELFIVDSFTFFFKLIRNVRWPYRQPLNPKLYQRYSLLVVRYQNFGTKDTEILSEIPIS